jgi:hypothetical protein
MNKTDPFIPADLRFIQAGPSSTEVTAIGDAVKVARRVETRLPTTFSAAARRPITPQRIHQLIDIRDQTRVDRQRRQQRPAEPAGDLDRPLTDHALHRAEHPQPHDVETTSHGDDGGTRRGQPDSPLHRVDANRPGITRPPTRGDRHQPWRVKASSSPSPIIAGVLIATAGVDPTTKNHATT